MVLTLILPIALFYGFLRVHAQSPSQLSFIPVVVKNPDLNAWLPRSPGNTNAPADQWPNFYTNDRILGWDALIRVDGFSRHWMGFNFTSTSTVASEITPTKSVFRIQAGPIQFNATFFSPVEPRDYIRQSVPFSYMYLDGFTSLDSQSHRVQVYSDISAEWVTRDNSALVQWDTVLTEDMVYHNIARQSPQQAQAGSDFPEDGTVYFAMGQRSGHTWRTGVESDTRQLFTNNGSLDNTSDTRFRAVKSGDRPVFAHALDLGTISLDNSAQIEPVVWAIGLVRDPLLVYPDVPQTRTGYYWSEYSDIKAAISSFLEDFPSALQRSQALDVQIMSLARQISDEYAEVTALVTRQIFTSMHVTLVKDGEGNFDKDNVRVYMKDLGRSSRTNPVDVVYGGLPALLYLNSTLVGPLLEALLEIQKESTYAAPDIASALDDHFRNSSLAVDSSSSMLIMAYTHAVKTGDGFLLRRYSSTLERWADYLVTNINESLNLPSGTTTSEGFSDAGTTNLALKAILGVWSMAKISEAIGGSGTAYLDHARQLAASWTQLAVTESHILSEVGKPDSWGLMYNLFYARWLRADFIDNLDDILTRQAEFYSQQHANAFGFGIDNTNSDLSYLHWALMTAATVPNSLTSVRDSLIHSVYQHAFSENITFPLPIVYNSSTGQPISGNSASAIHGAAYVLLALSQPNLEIGMGPSSTDGGPSLKNPTNTGAIVGGVVGGVGGALLIFILIGLRLRRLRSPNSERPTTRPRPFPLIRPFLRRTRFSIYGSSPRGKSSLGTPTLVEQSLPSGVSTKHREVSSPATTHVTTGVGTATVTRATVGDSASGEETGAEDVSLRVEVAQLRRDLESIRRETNLPPAYT